MAVAERRLQPVGMRAGEHLPDLLAVEPAAVLQLVGVQRSARWRAPRRGSRSSASAGRARPGSSDRRRGRWRCRPPPSPRAAPPPRWSRPAPGSRRARNTCPARSAPERPSRQRSPSIASMMTTGSTRGKMRVSQRRAGAGDAAALQRQRPAAAPAEAVRRVPVEIGARLRQRGEIGGVEHALDGERPEIDRLDVVGPRLCVRDPPRQERPLRRDAEQDDAFRVEPQPLRLARPEARHERLALHAQERPVVGEEEERSPFRRRAPRRDR